jgi:hypothetical protein
MSRDEIEDVRRSAWLEHQRRKRARARRQRAVHRRFASIVDYATAGFKDKRKIGFSGFPEEAASGATE